MVRVPERVLMAVGVNVTPMVQVLVGVMVPQVVERAKSPEAEVLEMIKSAVPQLVTVSVTEAEVVPTGWLLKLMEAGPRHTAGVVWMPMPESVMVWGEPEASSVNDSVPLRMPEALG
jgi:hypothetical protein